MPPKGPGKKAAQKVKERTIEDKTFGLKNKNKSKAVQKYIHAVTTAVQSSGGKQAKAEEKKRLERQAAKLAKKQAEEERNALFGAALAAGVKKRVTKIAGQKDTEEKEFEPAKQDEQKMTAQEALELKQREKAEAKANSGPVIEQVTFIIEEGAKTLEDFIEEKRAELAAKGIQGTPVTPETFAKWKEDRRRKRQEENIRRVQEEQRKKKGGRGLSVLSGKALFEYDPTLFVDDDAALDDDDERALAAQPQEADPDVDQDGYQRTDDHTNSSEYQSPERKEGESELPDVQVQEDLFADDADEYDLDDAEPDEEGEVAEEDEPEAEDVKAGPDDAETQDDDS